MDGSEAGKERRRSLGFVDELYDQVSESVGVGVTQPLRWIRNTPQSVSIPEDNRALLKVCVALRKPVQQFDHSDVIYAYNIFMNICKVSTLIF